MYKKSLSQRARSKQANVTCKRITALIVDYLAGELDPKTSLAFENHLGDCPDCVAFLNTYKKTVQAARSLCYEDIPPEIQKRVRQFLREKIKGLPSGR